ncbi:MAG: hypothetical protein JNM31_02500 [Flavobacteriales bacterium]|nr:hypothetical protein [Flavobacteriales bacterium]
MKLDRSTYEAWLLDRIEGNLSPEQERELDAFLAANPDLAPGSDDLGGLPHIASEPPPFLDKTVLHRDLPPRGAVTAQTLIDHLVARLEGDLDPDLLAALERYLANHPEALREAYLMDATKLHARILPFADKTQIQRSFPPLGMPDRHRLDDYLVARMEGELTPEQEVALTALLATDAALERSAALMGRTRIAATSITYANKARLKKHTGRVIVLWPRLAAAASIALLIGLGWWALDRSRNVDPAPQVATTPERTDAIGPDAKEPREDLVTNGPSPKADPVEDRTPLPTAPRTKKELPAQAPGAPLDQLVPEAPPIDPADRPLLAESPIEAPRPQETHARPETLASAQAPVVQASQEPAVTIGGAERAAPSNTFTLGEFVADVVRTGVLKQEREEPRPLDRRDAVSLADAGMKAVSGGQAGVSRDDRRLVLRLGSRLSITASR